MKTITTIIISTLCALSISSLVAVTQASPSPSLLTALATGNSNSIKEALAQGADINERDESGNTALHVLARLLFNNKIEHDDALALTQQFITNNKNLVDIPNNYGYTPLFLAAHYGDPHMAPFIDLLLKAGANPHFEGAETSPLIEALNSCDMDTIVSFVRHNSDLNQKTNYGTSNFFEGIAGNCRYTPQHLALIKILLQSPTLSRNTVIDALEIVDRMNNREPFKNYHAVQQLLTQWLADHQEYHEEL